MIVVWHASAEASLLAIPHWRTASRVAAAVERFAQTGEGAPKTVRGRPGLYELRAEGYRVLFTVLGSEIAVWSVHRVG